MPYIIGARRTLCDVRELGDRVEDRVHEAGEVVHHLRAAARPGFPLGGDGLAGALVTAAVVAGEDREQHAAHQRARSSSVLAGSARRRLAAASAGGAGWITRMRRGRIESVNTWLAPTRLPSTCASRC